MKVCCIKIIIFIIFLQLTAAFFGGCDSESGMKAKFRSELQTIREKHVPDRALDILQAEVSREGGRWVLSGETTVPEATAEVHRLADSLLGKERYRDAFVKLPHSDLGDSTHAIVKISVANIREEPRVSAQLVDQNIMGQTLLLLKYNRGWYFIQTEYGYLGWMTRGSFVRIDSTGLDQWKQATLVRVKELFPIVYARPDPDSEPVTDAVLNALLKLEKPGPLWSRVSTPDGRTGFIRSSSLAEYQFEEYNQNDLPASIIHSARGMMGIPYLWGGNSAKANDCSGYTQTIFRANGVNLPRDSRQQALLGEEITPDDTFSNILPGDLLFFGSKERVTHVGISLGGAEFIHQSGMVGINSLNPEDPHYSPYRHKSLKFIKRIL